MLIGAAMLAVLGLVIEGLPEKEIAASAAAYGAWLAGFAEAKADAGRLSYFETLTAIKRPHKEASQITRLVVALNRRENEFDRPFGRVAFGFKRICETQTTHNKIRRSGAAAIKLRFNILAFT